LQNDCIDDKINKMNLLEIQLPIADQLLKMEQYLQKQLLGTESIPQELSQINSIFKGKKVRATLFFLLNGLNNKNRGKLIEIAAGIELLHLASLVHDDIIDNAQLRRGQKTLNFSVGNSFSLLGGDFFFIKALSIIHHHAPKEILSSFLKATEQMLNGQLLELTHMFDYQITKDIYGLIIERKTSAFFACIAESVCILNKMGQCPEFYNFGIAFGNMFQLVDDLIDVFSPNTGKDFFNDFKQGRVTLPFILLFEKLSNQEITQFKNLSPQLVMTLLKTHKIREKCLQILDIYWQQCLAFLSPFPDSLFKKSLLDLISFVRKRDY
jgi:geranylgeranyl pyrophosphate synthase